jgi:hypothetical protein
VNGFVEDDVGSISQQPGRSSQAEVAGVEGRPFVGNAIGERVDVVEVVGEDIDEGPCGVACVEPNPAEQLTVRAANVPVGIVPDLDAGQLSMRRELLGEVDVFHEADLLIEPSSDFLLADGRAEQVVRQLDLIAQRRPTSESFHPTQHSHPAV